MTTGTTEAPRPVLTFEEEGHIYRVDGRPVISNTQVLKAVYGDLVWPWANEFAMERGRMVHKALHLFILGVLDPKSLSSYIAGYVAGGIRFLSESNFEIVQLADGPASETRMYSPLHDVAGTSDLFGTFNRKKACIDWKTGEPGWVAGPQTWMYTQMWQEAHGEIVRDRYAVQLFDDGTYKPIPYKDDRNDRADFLAALRVHQRRRQLAS